MQLIKNFTQKVAAWSAHRHAPVILFGLSFAEASFFPIPPDVMLAPMAMASPGKAWRNALLTTLASALGGIFGYLLGCMFISVIQSYLQRLGYAEAYQHVLHWFTHWGFWVILFAGFSPIPYKLFTIASGAIAMPLLPFIVGSLIGRGSRFFMVNAIILWSRTRMSFWVSRRQTSVANKLSLDTSR
jgi:membrane protein YqaA with SNARE-associated domain